MWRAVICLLIAGCSPPLDVGSLPNGRFREYEEAPDAWEALCTGGRYPFVAGELITHEDALWLDQVYACPMGCAAPQAGDVNARCEMIVRLSPWEGF